MKWAAYSAEVEQALAEARPVVALESSVWAQGLPRPINLEVARECQEAVRAAGATPAIVWLHEGRVRFGLTESELEDLCGPRLTAKVGIGDIPAVLAKGGEGATTVSATLALAERANIQVMATGGLGGVHLQWTSRPDFSSDLTQLARSRCLTVCSGVKAVLDVPATVEMLETLGIPVALYGTDRFPRFYTSGLSIKFGFRVNDLTEAIHAYQLSLATLERGLVLANPVPSAHELPPGEVEGWLRQGLEKAETEGHTGKAMTPFLLDYLSRASGGRTLEANRALLLANARLAAELAVVLNKSHG
ncbi:pseudouridine-5'-phosphate glycosidase [bacterium CPR1]|nr:pseudouridine-5'-phosphate glycosidase [bacterium CPR1]